MSHVEGLGASIVAVAKAPIERVAAFAADRGWRHLKLISAAGNSFKRDYTARTRRPADADPDGVP